MRTRQAIVVPNPIDPMTIVGSLAELFDLGAEDGAIDLTSHDFTNPEVEELLLMLEANFALGQKHIMVIIAPPADHEHLKESRDRIAQLISANSVITEVAIEGGREAVESLKRFLKDKLYATMPIYAEVT